METKRMFNWSSSISNVLKDTDKCLLSLNRSDSQVLFDSPRALHRISNSNLNYSSDDLLKIVRKELASNRYAIEESIRSATDDLKHEVKSLKKRIVHLERENEESSLAREDLADRLREIETQRKRQFLREPPDFNELEMNFNELKKNFFSFKHDIDSEIHAKFKASLTKDDIRSIYDNVIEDVNQRLEIYSVNVQEAIDFITKTSSENNFALEKEIDSLRYQNVAEELKENVLRNKDALLDRIGEIEQRMNALEDREPFIINESNISQSEVISFREDEEPPPKEIPNNDDLIEKIIQEFVKEELDIGKQLMEAVIERSSSFS